MITPHRTTRPVEPYYPTVLDIETDGENVIAVGFGWWDSGLHYHACETYQEWLIFFSDLFKHANEKLRRRLRRIYAHNGAGFDWLFLIQECLDHDFVSEASFIASDSFAIGAKIKFVWTTEKEGYIHLRDSYRLLPKSLAKLTKSFKVETPKIELEMMPADIKRTKPDLFWDYLRHDVRGLQEVLYRFWSMVVDMVGDIGELPMTLPALAMRLWRMTLKEDVFTTWNEDVKKLERRSYIGGRTECFKAGEAAVKVYDYNSIYPTAMFTNEFPVSYRGCWTKTYNGKHGIYEVLFNQTDRTIKPILRDEETDKYVYEGSGVFCQPEIEFFVRMGGEIVVKRGWVYVKVGRPFESFIGTWWQRRKQANDEGDEALSYVAKILMNSLYGKFGQREEHQSIVLIDKEHQKRAMKEGKLLGFLGAFSIVREENKSENTFVAIASYVTSYSRIILYNGMMNTDDIWYCDTDSIHVGSGNTLPESDDLGGLKIEYDGIAAYAGKKLYAKQGTGEIKSKGVRSQVKTVTGIDILLTYDDIRAIALDASASKIVDYPSLPTWKEVLSGKVKPGHETRRVRTLRQTVNGP